MKLVFSLLLALQLALSPAEPMPTEPWTGEVTTEVATEVVTEITTELATEVTPEPPTEGVPEPTQPPQEHVWEEEPDVPSVGGRLPASSCYWVEPYANYQKFVNSVDGYSIELPLGMEVSMENAAIGARLTDEHRSVQIFKEKFSSRSEVNNYIYYSNRFTENTNDHTVEYRETVKYNNYEIHILQWTRRVLGRVEKDKNYYACIDVVRGYNVYTFYFKADLPFYMCGGYMEIVRSIVTFTPTVANEDAHMPVYKTVEHDNWSKETKDFFYRYFSPISGQTWGIFENDAPIKFDRLRQIEQELEHRFRFVLKYTELRPTFDPNEVTVPLENAYKEGRTVELTLQTPVTSDGNNMIYQVLNGDYDTFLYEYAKAVAKFGHPVLFRPFNEMNGDWCLYSAWHFGRDTDLYQELYRYLYKIFDSCGASNVVWIFNPNGKSFPDYKWNAQEMYYPGDGFVDIFGLTAYNTGNYYPGETWQSFDELYYNLYVKAINHNEKPLMITEFACSRYGGDKEAWVEDMFRTLPNYGAIKVAIWWNGCDFDGNVPARPYYINDSPALLEIFRKNLKNFSQ